MNEWKIAEYSQQGISHKKRQMPCQDAISVETSDQGSIVAALSDGLGHYQYSQIASDEAVKATCRWFLDEAHKQDISKLIRNPNNKNINNDFKQKLLSDVRGAIRAQAAEKNIPETEMDCNLTFVVIRHQENTAIIGNLGDCATCMCAHQKDGCWNSMAFTAPCIAGGGTASVLKESSEQEMLIQSIDLKDRELAFVLTSDGLENEIYSKGSRWGLKAADRYINALREPYPEQEIARLCQSLVKDDSGFDDDLSIVVLSNTSEEVSLPEDPTWLCSCGFRNPLQTSYCAGCNADFIKIYDPKLFEQDGDKYFYFAKLNHQPEKERLVLKSSLRVNEGCKETSAADQEEPAASDASETSKTSNRAGLDIEQEPDLHRPQNSPAEREAMDPPSEPIPFTGRNTHKSSGFSTQFSNPQPTGTDAAPQKTKYQREVYSSGSVTQTVSAPKPERKKTVSVETERTAQVQAPVEPITTATLSEEIAKVQAYTSQVREQNQAVPERAPFAEKNKPGRQKVNHSPVQTNADPQAEEPVTETVPAKPEPEEITAEKPHRRAGMSLMLLIGALLIGLVAGELLVRHRTNQNPSDVTDETDAPFVFPYDFTGENGVVQIDPFRDGPNGNEYYVEEGTSESVDEFYVLSTMDTQLHKHLLVLKNQSKTYQLAAFTVEEKALRVRSETDYGADVICRALRTETVYRVSGSETHVNDDTWVLVLTEQNELGWCLLSDIQP